MLDDTPLISATFATLGEGSLGGCISTDGGVSDDALLLSATFIVSAVGNGGADSNIDCATLDDTVLAGGGVSGDTGDDCAVLDGASVPSAIFPHHFPPHPDASLSATFGISFCRVGEGGHTNDCVVVDGT